ncbi:MAG: phenylalanine--tRNA ligase subunit alpha [Deltaproteobacteria bacterium]|nr:phenylalanine--tRNA ligase subunit alpha [Deltaproteobacteria bacterium]
MKEALESIRRAAVEALAAARDEAAVEALRVRYLGRQGELTTVVRQMRDVAPADRPAMGALLNATKDEIESRIAAALADARGAARQVRAAERLDITIPGRRPPLGRTHPLLQVMDEITDVFRGLGFSVAEGPEVEDDYHNFEALNFPDDHPARDMQDTLFLTDGHVLRTHTSPVQIRVMEARKPPLRVIVPGAVYRHDSDTTHSPMFHQIEGFMVDTRITFGDLQGVLTHALQAIFGAGLPVRLRPSFFPFTEPSAEADVGCFNCARDGSPCRVCKATGWVEILGAGMIDPNVFRAVGYDPEAVSGFAFGLGIERITMLRYQIDDIRLLFGSDLRFLRQF